MFIQTVRYSFCYGPVNPPRWNSEKAGQEKTGSKNINSLTKLLDRVSPNQTNCSEQHYKNKNKREKFINLILLTMTATLPIVIKLKEQIHQIESFLKGL